MRSARLSRVDACTCAIMVSAVLVALPVPTLAKGAFFLLAALAACLGGPSATAPVVIAALPFWMIEITIHNQQAGSLELALLLAALSCGAWLARSINEHRSLSSVHAFLPPADLGVLLALLALIGLASLLWVADRDLRPDSVRALRRVIIEPMLVVPALVWVVRKGALVRVVQALAFPAIGVSILAIGQFLLGDATVDIGGVARPIGTFTHPNNLSFFLERAIWFVPAALAPFTKHVPRMTNLPMAIVLAALVATLSRGAALGLAGGAIVYLWPLPLRYWKQATAGFLGLVAIAFGARFLADSDSSLGSREVIWRSALHMVRNHPVTGIGLDQFLGQYGRRYIALAGWPERYTSHPHNLILDFWLSLGIGGVFILWLMLETMWRRVRHAVQTPTTQLQRAAAAMLVAGLVHGLFDNSFFLPDLATWTWIGLVLSSELSASDRVNPQLRPL